VTQRDKLQEFDYLTTLEDLQLWRICDAADFVYFPQELRQRIDRHTLQQWSEYQTLRQREIDREMDQ